MKDNNDFLGNKIDKKITFLDKPGQYFLTSCYPCDYSE